MTASKDMSRPASSQHRLSVGSPAAAAAPVRQAYNRASSSSLGSSAHHRINRRKSSSFAPGNAAALEAAVENGVADGSVAINRRGSASRAALSSLNNDDANPPPLPSSLPYHSIRSGSAAGAVTDGPSLSSFPAVDKARQKRRASDGTHLTKKEKAATGELKCEHCGKAYKHGSCLTKHLWEHTPEWQYTSKLLISKHQQVQLLEAASVLVAMNQDGPEDSPPAQAQAQNDSDSSASSARASGSSAPRSPASSSASPPPPSTTASTYSRSYQSQRSLFSHPESAPTTSSSLHSRHWSASSNGHHHRSPNPTAIAASYPDEDPADLAAAVGLLSCSYGGTPKSGPTVLPSLAESHGRANGDVPPVPPLPAKYQALDSHVRDDVSMADLDEEDERAEERRLHRHQQMMGGDEDEGVFGNMEA